MKAASTTTWSDANLQLNRTAFEMALAEFVESMGNGPETLHELQTVWRRQSVILADLKEV